MTIDELNALADQCPSGRDILDECLTVAHVLLVKNTQYGDSALTPLRILSRADAVEQLKVRIDDKLSRIGRGNGDGQEDAELDLAGYFVLLRVARRRAAAGAR